MLFFHPIHISVGKFFDFVYIITHTELRRAKRNIRQYVKLFSSGFQFIYKGLVTGLYICACIKQHTEFISATPVAKTVI